MILRLVELHDGDRFDIEENVNERYEDVDQENVKIQDE